MKKFQFDNLKGKIWLSQFVYTVCTDACPPMMNNMADLDKKLIDEGVEDYKIVSFSIDPAVDTPEALQVYLDLFDIQDQSELGNADGLYTRRILLTLQ